jgi:hypothetical protein
MLNRQVPDPAPCILTVVNLGGPLCVNCNTTVEMSCRSSNLLIDLTYLSALKYKERYKWQSEWPA